jgi:NAD(P) transhydrogenase subunit alpha
MQLGILKSISTPLVALTPSIAPKYQKAGFKMAIEKGAGLKSFFSDDLYEAVGVSVADRKKILGESDVVLVDSQLSMEDLGQLKSGALLIGKFNVLSEGEYVQKLKNADNLVFSLDMVPRSSIAQSMDVLSSFASLSGYKAVISAAERFPGYFPMMTTAAGTVPPAKVLVLGAGVAGLQAIATAKRLGASVEAFDVRSAVKEEVESLGAKFIEVPGSTEDEKAGGYAVTQSEEYIQKQKELIQERAGKADIVITTANIPGKKAPLLVEKKTVGLMRPGSVIVDLASATGGNCELTENNKEIEVGGVKILGNSNLFHQLPREASRLYSTNIYNFIQFILKDGMDSIPYEHEIVQKTLLTKHRMTEIATN